jgi:uncharacterized protein YecE (DUF72 family)
VTDAKPRIHIGTQGWNYDAWVGPFYPEGTRPADFLPVYSRAFTSVEVDSTFYGVPAPTTFRSWYDRTPDNFIFSLKLPQEITHEQRLRDTLGIGETFYERARELRHKLGPILVQLGPDFDPGELPSLVLSFCCKIFSARSPFHIQSLVDLQGMSGVSIEQPSTLTC